MNRATIVSFYQYTPRGMTNHYRNFFEYFKKTLEVWGKEVDKVYLVDQDWHFTDKDREDLKRLTNDFEIMESVEQGHHWVQFFNLLPRVKEENVMMMDNDTFIYERGLVDKHFRMLEEGYDLVSMFDGSGGMHERIWERFPFLKERGYARLGPYLCFIKRHLLSGLDFAPQYYKPNTYIEALDYRTGDNDWLDSFGEATLKILAQNPKVAFIEDDRTSLFFYADHSVKPAYEQPQTGSYHLRNWNLGLHLINEKKNNGESYEHFKAITPIQESLRLLGWLWVLSEKVNKLSDALRTDILGIVLDYGANEQEWSEFISKFKELHRWI